MSRHFRASLFHVARSAFCKFNRYRRNGDPSERIRNDRGLSVPLRWPVGNWASRIWRECRRACARQKLETFTIAATALEGKDVRIVGWGDATAALALVRDSMEH